MIGYSARDVSNLDRYLTLRSLLMTRFVSSFGAYFLVAVRLFILSQTSHYVTFHHLSQLFYSLLSIAFQVDFSHRYGASGFVIFWMLNWAGMLSVCAHSPLTTIPDMYLIPRFHKAALHSRLSLRFLRQVLFHSLCSCGSLVRISSLLDILPAG
jgi:hypothetical protein